VISNNIIRHQHWIKITAYLPDNVQICGSKSVELQLNNLVDSCAETEFELCTDMYEGSRLEFIIDVSLIGRHSYGAMKVTLLCSN